MYKKESVVLFYVAVPVYLAIIVGKTRNYRGIKEKENRLLKGHSTQNESGI